LLQAESEHDVTAEEEEQTPASAKNKFKNKIFRGTLKRPRYQTETASAVLMKYLVESNMEREAETPVDPIDVFFNSIAAREKRFLLIIETFANVFEVETTEMTARDLHAYLSSQ
jgi:hypothetical protein